MKTTNIHAPKIVVIGVGGAGGNMVKHMVNRGLSSIDIIALNSDLEALQYTKAPIKIQIGSENTTMGSTTIGPATRRNSAIESYESIKDVLKGANIVFIVAGLGSGTGTGASFIVAKAAQEIGAVAVAFVTKPFKFEGKRMECISTIGIDRLKKHTDYMIIVSNEKALEINGSMMKTNELFYTIDDILYQLVSGVCEAILDQTSSNISNVLDKESIKSILSIRIQAFRHHKYLGFV